MKKATEFENEVNQVLQEWRQGWIQISRWGTAADLGQIGCGKKFFKDYHSNLYNFLIKFKESQDDFFNDFNFPLNQNTLDVLKIEISEDNKIGQKLISVYKTLLSSQQQAKENLFPLQTKCFSDTLEKAKAATLKAKEKLQLKIDSLQKEVNALSVTETFLLQEMNYRREKLNALQSITNALDTVVFAIDQTKEKAARRNVYSYPSIKELRSFLLQEEEKINKLVFDTKKNTNVGYHEGMGLYINVIIGKLTLGFAKLRTETEEKLDDCIKVFNCGFR